jgi:hypothetical protein
MVQEPSGIIARSSAIRRQSAQEASFRSKPVLENRLRGNFSARLAGSRFQCHGFVLSKESASRRLRMEVPSKVGARTASIT